MDTTPVSYKKYKTDEDKAKVYNHRLATADNDFQRWESKANDWWGRYENTPRRTQSTKKGLLVNVPTGVAIIDSLFSGLTAVDVEFTLEAQANATPEQGFLAETALNAEWAANHVDDARDDAIKDALITGIGFLKVGYDFYEMEEEVDRDPEDIAAEVSDLLEEAAAAGKDAPTLDDIRKLVPDKETVTFALRDHIAVDYVPWDMVRWDPSAKRWNDVRWVAQLTKMQLHEVQENEVFREYAKRSRRGLKRLSEMEPDSSIDKELLTTQRPLADDGRVTVVEFWDFETGTYCTFIRGQNWLLHEGVNPYAMQAEYRDRSPFVPLVLRKSTRRIRGISDMEVMERSLNEKNLYRSRTAEYIRRSVPKVIGPEDALTEEGKEALQNDEVNAYVSIDRGVDARTAVIPISPPVLPEQAFNMNDRIDDEIREATGVNELMRGLFPDRKRTATETSEVVSASAARQSEKRNTLERFHVEVGKRMLHLMMMFYDQPRMVRFIDPELGNIPWEFSGADIIGDFDMRVTLEPREAQTRDQQRQEATVALNVLGPMAQPGPDGSSTVDPQRLIAWFMKKYGFSPRDINELLNNQDEKADQTAQTLALQAASAAAQQGAQTLATAAVPPDVAAGAVAGNPVATEQVSESRGVLR